MDISVLMTVYNGEKTVESAISSILNQTMPPTEIIVVNDGSTDSTEDILNRYSDWTKIIILRNKSNLGLVKSLNYGLRQASCTWVARLDADDEWMNNHLEILCDLLTKRGSQKFILIANRAAIVSTNGVFINQSTGPLAHLEVLNELTFDNPFIHSAVLINRKAMLDIGGYSDKYIWEDYDAWINLAATGSTYISHYVTVNHYKSSTSLSKVDRSQSLEARFLLQRKAFMKFRSYCKLKYKALYFLHFIRAMLIRLGHGQRY